MALFKIYQEKSGEFRVLLKLNMQIEFISNTQSSKYACYKLINRIRKISESSTSYIRKKSNCGSVYFKLIGSSIHEELGESMLYINNTILDSKIAAMKEKTLKAKLDCEMYSV